MTVRTSGRCIVSITLVTPGAKNRFVLTGHADGDSVIAGSGFGVNGTTVMLVYRDGWQHCIPEASTELGVPSDASSWLITVSVLAVLLTGVVCLAVGAGCCHDGLYENEIAMRQRSVRAIGNVTSFAIASSNLPGCRWVRSVRSSSSVHSSFSVSLSRGGRRPGSGSKIEVRPPWPG